MKKHSPSPMVFVIGAILLLLFIALAYRLGGPPQNLSPGQTAQFDDFFLTALEAHHTSLRAPTAKPNMDTIELIVQVQNHAIRVPYHFDPRCVRVADRFRDHARFALLKAPDSQGDRADIPPGESRNYILIFQAPPGVETVQVSFAFGGPIGETIDTLLSGFRRVILPVTPR